MLGWNIQELHVFTAVALSGSMRGAAEVVNLSVPAISAKVKLLETALGVCLLERHPRGIALTPAGRRLFAHAQDLLEKAHLIDEDITEFSTKPKGLVKLVSRQFSNVG